MQDFAFALPLAHPSGVDSELLQAACFGVFDGHGGAEVAQSLAEHVPGRIQENVHQIIEFGPQHHQLCSCVQGEAHVIIELGILHHVKGKNAKHRVREGRERDFFASMSSCGRRTLFKARVAGTWDTVASYPA
eukprot:scaffold215547_cov24-Tisochrysis_lutea.AAC.2